MQFLFHASNFLLFSVSLHTLPKTLRNCFQQFLQLIPSISGSQSINQPYLRCGIPLNRVINTPDIRCATYNSAEHCYAFTVRFCIFVYIQKAFCTRHARLSLRMFVFFNLRTDLDQTLEEWFPRISRTSQF